MRALGVMSTSFSTSSSSSSSCAALITNSGWGLLDVCYALPRTWASTPSCPGFFAGALTRVYRTERAASRASVAARQELAATREDGDAYDVARASERVRSAHRLWRRAGVAYMAALALSAPCRHGATEVCS